MVNHILEFQTVGGGLIVSRFGVFSWLTLSDQSKDRLARWQGELASPGPWVDRTLKKRQ